MEKVFMRKNRLRICAFALLGFTLFNSACAQNPSFSGKDYVNEEKLDAQTTVLLNNAAYLIPLQNLAEAKVASIHFSNKYTTGFDSLLNKYTKVASFNGADYTGAKTLDDLSADLKWYNTIIVQLNDQ